MLRFFLEPILWCLRSTSELGSSSNEDGGMTAVSVASF